MIRRGPGGETAREAVRSRSHMVAGGGGDAGEATGAEGGEKSSGPSPSPGHC